MAATTTPEVRRLAGIEGLRGIAAWSLVVHHVYAFVRAPDGSTPTLPAIVPRLGEDLQWGLVLFFALSGFLLFRPFAAAILRGGALPDARTYLRSRALRILPAYWVVLLLTGFVLGVAYVRYPGELGRLTDLEVLISDLLLVQGFRVETLGSGIGPAWSLAVEALFYLLLPVLAAAAAFAARRRLPALPAVLLPPTLLLAVGLAGKELVTSTGATNALLNVSFLRNADLFAPGMLAAVAYTLWQDGRLRLPSWSRYALGAGAAALVLWMVREVGTFGPTHGHWTDLPVAMAVGGVLLLFATAPATGPARAAVRLLETRPFVLAGLCSYSVFLWNTPVILLLTREFGLEATDTPSWLFGLAAVSVVTAALSWATYRLVEVPALARKRGRSPARTPEPLPVAAG